MDEHAFRMGRAALEPLLRKVEGRKVLLDRDAAEYFEVELKTLNGCVKRHRNRFPPDFMIVFNDGELVDRELLSAARGFTDAGVDMLAMLLKSKKAVAHSIESIREGVAALKRADRSP